jgi:hypothetical protein
MLNESHLREFQARQSEPNRFIGKWLHTLPNSKRFIGLLARMVFPLRFEELLSIWQSDIQADRITLPSLVKYQVLWSSFPLSSS